MKNKKQTQKPISRREPLHKGWQGLSPKTHEQRPDLQSGGGGEGGGGGEKQFLKMPYLDCIWSYQVVLLEH